jgi:hypothetical protein
MAPSVPFTYGRQLPDDVKRWSYIGPAREKNKNWGSYGPYELYLVFVGKVPISSEPSAENRRPERALASPGRIPNRFRPNSTAQLIKPTEPGAHSHDTTTLTPWVLSTFGPARPTQATLRPRRD